MITNVNFDFKIVRINWERTNDPDLFIQALDEWVEELIDKSYGIYNI